MTISSITWIIVWLVVFASVVPWLAVLSPTGISSNATYKTPRPSAQHHTNNPDKTVNATSPLGASPRVGRLLQPHTNNIASNLTLNLSNLTLNLSGLTLKPHLINNHTAVFYINKLERNQNRSAIVVVKLEPGITKGLAPTLNLDFSKAITSPTLDIVEKAENLIGKGIDLIEKSIHLGAEIKNITGKSGGHFNKPPTLNPGTQTNRNTTQFPIPKLLLSRVVVEATNRTGAIIHYDTIANLNCTPPSGHIFPIRDTTVICTAKDKAGNSSPAASFQVTVQDKTPPKISVPHNKIVNATSPLGTNVTFTATAVDNVDGPTPVTCTPHSGTTSDHFKRLLWI
jgi:hypothetical protein